MVWKEVAPVMAVLKEKDPENFEAMVVLAKSFSFKKAIKSFTELDQMTYEQVLTVRYNSMKKKILADDDFRRGQWEDELAAREETRELKKQERQRQVQDLILLSEKRPGFPCRSRKKLRLVFWILYFVSTSHSTHFVNMCDL